PVLMLPDLSKPFEVKFEVKYDACGDCLGAVLLQEGHTIAYESRRLNTDERVDGGRDSQMQTLHHPTSHTALDTLPKGFLDQYIQQNHQNLLHQLRLSNIIISNRYTSSCTSIPSSPAHPCKLAEAWFQEETLLTLLEKPISQLLRPSPPAYMGRHP
ncbi:hypothetical protein GOP47_0029688, partial [Adiantum capillus-veneris]